MSLLAPEEATAIFNPRSHTKPNEQTVSVISSVKYVLTYLLVESKNAKKLSNPNMIQANITKLSKSKKKNSFYE